MTNYQLLVRVLDRLCKEAPATYVRYHPAVNDIEAVNAARCRAYIHLLLKSYFGLLDFGEREVLLTEGSYDGGVDAYYIDEEMKVVYFIQSKFRTTEENFLEKPIDLEELLRMDLDRMLKGETQSSNGQSFSGKTQGMIRRIAAIPDIGRYRYKVIILANVYGITREKVTQLTGGFPCEVLDYSSAYGKLVFPLITGTYFTPESLHISLKLSNKNSGPKISYEVDTEFTACTITVVFVPAIEIAKAMHRFRNAILKFNPRSYLEHEGQSVNAAIRSSIENRTTNEFALFNNGITILSDESYLNERIGQKDKARLTMVNPQIINGGQTAYTLME